MKKSTFHCQLFAALLCAGLFSSFSGFAQGARMLPKSGSEIAFGYTGFTSLEGEGGLVNLLGIGFGYGAGEKVNVKFRYNRLFSDVFDSGLNLISLTPKFALKPNKVAALLPVSALFVEGESIWAVSPGLQFSAGNTNTSEFTAGVRCDIPFSDAIEGVLFSATLGAGFSKDLDRWAVRPEVGVLFSTDEGDPVFTFGVGANFALNASKG